uniref:Uncharacterized protein n=1 Tax=Meloidogyne javanica TaxID=6303 RepID=A0A915LWR4_MELJA
MRDKAKMLLLPFNLVWLALILASNLDVGAAANNFDEDGVLYEWRIKRLKQIAEIDKSTGMPRGGVYSNDAIKFEEYKFLEGNKEKYKTLFETFNKAFGRLVTKVAEFAQLNLKNINISLDETEVIANELKIYDEIVVKESQTHLMPETANSSNNKFKTMINIVIKCKIFMADLCSKGTECSLLDIYSFMENSHLLKDSKDFSTVTELDHLKIIFVLTKIQSKEMDKAIIEEIYNQHLENKKKLSKEYKNVIVEGAGPVGLYAAFELFMEGMNVTAVSGYSKSLDDKIHLDNKFLSKIRFILATEFDKLFSEKEDSLIKLVDNEIVLKLKDFENALKERLNVLSNFVREKGQNSVLKLIIDKKVLEINTVNERPMAILDKFDKEKNVEIPHRYFYGIWLIYFGMKVVENNSQSSLTRTGKVYKTFNNGSLWYNDNSKYSENISIQIKETETTIQIESNIPMAIVELIEEVKSEREELKKMNYEEFKKKREEAIMEELKYKHNKELNERLEEVKNEQRTILNEDLKELNERFEKINKEIKDFEMKRKNLKVSKKLEEKVDKRDEILEELKDIQMGNNKERKGKFKKIKEMILKGKSKRNQKKIRKSSQMKSEDLMNKEIEENKTLLEELQKLEEKYANGGIDINTEEGKKFKKSLKLYKDYKEIEKEIKQLENQRDSLDVSKNLEEKINEKEEIMFKINEIEDNNYKEKDEKLDKIRNEQEKILEEKLEKIKFENDKIFEGDLEVGRKKMLENYVEFIVELKERWFKALFYHVLDKEYKDEDKKKVIIELSKEEGVKVKGEASTSYNVETNEAEQEKYVLYFDKNSLDDVENAVFAIKEYNKGNEQNDLTKMLMDALKKTEIEN